MQAKAVGTELTGSLPAMPELRKDIEQKFYDVLKHRIDLASFESWLYQNDLETELPEGKYIDLISLNYKDKYAHNELENLIKDLVDFGKFEIHKLKEILESIIRKDNNCAESIELTYEFYCSGYNFLRRLGLSYGLLVSCPPAGNYQKTWNEITLSEQDELLNKLYPNIITDAENALDWLRKGKIIIKNSVDELGNYKYDDLRSASEIQQGEIEVIKL